MPDPVLHEQLERAADAFDDLTTARGWGERPLLLRMERGLDPEGAALGVKELDDHPAQALLGLSAPIAWTAIGVSAEGWATPCTDTDHGYRADAPPQAGQMQARARVRTLVLVDRDGQAAGRLRWEDGRVVTEAPAEGLIVDCLRRAMGRRTSPPTETTATLFTTIWLGNVVAAARRRHRQVGWPGVVGLHPAVQVLTRTGPKVKPGELVDAANALARLCDWTMVRHQVIAGWQPCDIDRRVAVWMDTGMLSRWLLERWPTIDELLEALEVACPPVVLQRIRRSITRMSTPLALRPEAAPADQGASGRRPEPLIPTPESDVA